MMTSSHTIPNARSIRRGTTVVAGVDVVALKERSDKKELFSKIIIRLDCSNIYIDLVNSES
jgi:hypothetical protein